MSDPFPSATPPIVEIERLTRQFGTKAVPRAALRDVPSLRSALG